MRPLKTINVTDLPLSFIQDNVENFTNQFGNKKIIEGISVTRIAMTSGVDKVVNHKLGRQWLGWIVTRKSNAADVFESSTSNPAPKNTIILQANANVTLDLWVF